MQSLQSLGGLAKAKKINDLYNLSPNKCLFCGNSILRQKNQSLTDVKAKKFCNRSCAAKYNNNFRKKLVVCSVCGTQIKYGRKKCDICLKKYVSRVGHILKRESTDSKIRNHARLVYRDIVKEIKCCNCGFNHFTEICHKKPVKDFTGDTTLAVINDFNNLTQLCPNCHWDFDHNIIVKL